MIEIKDETYKQDDEIAKRIIEKYKEALQERGGICFLALPFAEDDGFRKAPKDAPLYLPCSRHYYLQDWLCELDGRKYSVECMIGASKDCLYSVAPEYKLKQLGHVDMTIHELDNNHKIVREIARLARGEHEDKGKTTWRVIYYSKRCAYRINEDNNNETDINVIFDCIARKTRFQYGDIKKAKDSWDRYGFREITGWEGSISTDESKRPTHFDFEKAVFSDRLARGVRDIRNNRLLDRPSEIPDDIQE